MDLGDFGEVWGHWGEFRVFGERDLGISGGLRRIWGDLGVLGWRFWGFGEVLGFWGDLGVWRRGILGFGGVWGILGGPRGPQTPSETPPKSQIPH